ncbi:MAG: DNA repair protein RecN, partial [Candidatus Saganbacteria bacterium]|nr:DNA repair protein RecN [Candidatus Saganbacteria bacterium]
MLNSLNIENYALIEKLDLKLGKNFIVLTGETGAGKSIIVGALSMVLGERTSGDVIRTGCDRAFVEAEFDISQNNGIRDKLKEVGIEPEETLIISREVSSGGRGQARINGRIVTQSILKLISRSLLDIHGQHEHQSLLYQESHIELLDALGGREHLKQKEDAGSGFLELEEKKGKLNFLLKSKEEREKQIDFLKFQIKEITEAGLLDGEEEKLREERELLANASKLIEASGEVYKNLAGEDESSSLSALKIASARLKDIGEIDKKMFKLSRELEEAVYTVEDVSREISIYQEKVAFDPDRQQVVEDRLDLINRFKKKYGETVKTINSYAKDKEKELRSLTTSDEELSDLEEEIKKLAASLGKKCQELSDRRASLAIKIEKKVMEELADLNMEKTKFKVDIRNTEDPNGIPAGGKFYAVNSNGIDLVEFLISPNPGEPLKPLAKIASGGEISRVMLAIKSILVSADHIPTMIFDEIDVGIGGKTANSVGEKLEALSKKRQI